MDLSALCENGWPCPTADEMAAIDAHAIESLGLPGRLLMESAGRAVARAILEYRPATRRALILCGAGNNGGDGFVIARTLREWDSRSDPCVVLVGDPSRMTDESRENFELLVSSGLSVTVGLDKGVEALLEDADLVVDAIFGVGLARPVDGALAQIVAAVNGSARPVVAVDLPTGLDATGGSALGTRMRADLIVTLGLPKLGLALQAQQGPVRVADLGLPTRAVEAVGVQQHLWTATAARARLPSRPHDGHKGTFGHVFVVGGSEGKTGAAALAAEGALHSGAGLVTVGVPAGLNSIFERKLTEAMSLPLGTDGCSQLPAEARDATLAAAQQRDALVLGPGVGTDPSTQRLVREVVAAFAGPTVLDADALNAFAGVPEQLAGAGPRVLTPHPGEASRLLRCTTTEVQSDRALAARMLAARSGCTVLLKGARSLIARPDGELRINPTGGPALASGGTGDVLAGLVGSLLAQGLDAFDAAALAAYVHGLAGDLQGSIGVAGEVARSLPRAIDRLRSSTGESDGDPVLFSFP